MRQRSRGKEQEAKSKMQRKGNKGQEGKGKRQRANTGTTTFVLFEFISRVK